jgi:radical SAM superfamily enzyme YgiQ (UPF0313 family)
VPGLVLPQHGLQAERRYRARLDDFPLPQDDFLQTCVGQQRDLPLPVQTRRGCAMKCSYCSTPTIEGPTVRSRSPEKAVEWIARRAASGFRSFYFVDNNFNIPLSYAKRLCKLLVRRGLDIRWRCILNPAFVDRELCSAMAAAGCVDASLGFESGCQRILTRMCKNFSPTDITRASALMREHGIRRMGFLLLGGPGETVETMERSLAFVDALELEGVRVTAGIRIYPQTAVAREAARQGLIDPSDDLLRPRFYLVPGLEKRIDELLAAWRSAHPEWIF